MMIVRMGAMWDTGMTVPSKLGGGVMPSGPGTLWGFRVFRSSPNTYPKTNKWLVGIPI